MDDCIPVKTKKLMERGVDIRNPLMVDIDDDVVLERISGKDVAFYGRVRISGADTVLCSGSRLGEEGPVTLVNCRLGRNVRLKGGFFRESLFLDRAEFGPGAQIREGCLIEEEAGGAHTVGLKQTVLFPFVTLGSLINFCDCLMAGGTSRKDHSEVGSSYIHFNYTPNQDKATASLIGDVPRGVMLRERPIFLGGQGGLAGPSRIGYGAVVAAGIILREDVEEGRLVRAERPRNPAKRDFRRGWYSEPGRILINNINYIANLIALEAWYRHCRKPFFEATEQGTMLYRGALVTLESAVAERLKRLGGLALNMSRPVETSDDVPGNDSPETAELRKIFSENWPALEDCIRSFDADDGTSEKRDAFLTHLEGATAAGSRDYLDAVRSLDEKAAGLGTAWLQEVVDRLVSVAGSVVGLS
jgi:bifunctional UDP-N-acetylglucosamine pyrophosphorylase / glucosamine-1-phosphate N-acetyltransferase